MRPVPRAPPSDGEPPRATRQQRDARTGPAAAEHPELYDPAKVEDLALQLLAVQDGTFSHAEPIAAIVARVDHSARLRDKLDELLKRDFSNEALGRLLLARRKLAND